MISSAPVHSILFTSKLTSDDTPLGLTAASEPPALVSAGCSKCDLGGIWMLSPFSSTTEI